MSVESEAPGGGQRSRDDADSRSRDGRPRNPLARMRTYYREVVAELRKVIYPTRSELVTYTVVVVVFVAVMVAIVSGFDLGFSHLDLLVFG
ncbi:MAG TPA: preprotein translocase subunit SecE [Mycobacteriales bacterium]